MTREERQEIRAKGVQMLKAGASKEQIMYELGVCDYTIWYWKKQEGLIKHKPTANDRKGEIIKLIQYGKSYEEVANMYGYTKKTIQTKYNSWMREERGYPLRNGGNNKKKELEGMDEIIQLDRLTFTPERKVFIWKCQYHGKRYVDKTGLFSDNEFPPRGCGKVIAVEVKKGY